MNISEFIDPVAINNYLSFHDKLNPKLWEPGGDLRVEVRVKLLKLALEFYAFLETPGLAVADVILTGSNAAFNYTPLSDIDLHLIVDFAGSTCPDLAENFFNTKKMLWNQTHDVRIRGFNTELYVQDTKNPVKANGIYSLRQGRWLQKPRSMAPRFDDTDVLNKTQQYADEIDALVDGTAQSEDIQSLMMRLRDLRRAGLAHGGEFSTENLTFKSLRNLGYLEKLSQAKKHRENDQLSLT
jgi:hypothetical protein